MDCSNCATPIERGDLRCSICGLATPAERASNAGPVAQVLRCNNCGAAVRYDANVGAPSCAFCGSAMHVEGIEDPLEQIEWFVTFGIDPDTAQKALGAWLGTRGFFTPSDLVSASTIQKLSPLWWVGWSFEVQALVSWTLDSNANTGHSQWAPYAGQQPMRFSNVVISASRGLRGDETAALIPRYNFASGAPQPYGPPAAVTEEFDVQRSAARALIVDAIERMSQATVASSHVPGSSHRHLKVTALIERLITRRCAMPSYVLAYRYKGRLYRAVIHGQDTSLIFGDTPTSILKVMLVVGGVLLAVVLSILILAVVLGS